PTLQELPRGLPHDGSWPDGRRRRPPVPRFNRFTFQGTRLEFDSAFLHDRSMKNAAAGTARTQPKSTRKESSTAPNAKIHPVVIYPFRQPPDYSDLEQLYQLIARLDAEQDKYSRPITVMDRKTYFAMEGNKPFLDFRKNVVARHSEILDAWCVDTCQMWYSGLGKAFEQGGPDDVYWLIPGHFNYGTAVGKEVLSRLHDLPEIILELQQDLCIGEIAADHNNSKQLIDTYGTF